MRDAIASRGASLEEAEAPLKQAVLVLPPGGGREEAQELLANLYVSHGRREEAVALYESALAGSLELGDLRRTERLQKRLRGKAGG